MLDPFQRRSAFVRVVPELRQVTAVAIDQRVILRRLSGVQLPERQRGVRGEERGRGRERELVQALPPGASIAPVLRSSAAVCDLLSERSTYSTIAARMLFT